MKYRNQFLVFAAFFVFTACTNPGTNGNGESPAAPNASGAEEPIAAPQPAPPDPAAEEAAMERQIKSMAHYAAAMSLVERGEPAEALEEFYQAALADPANEKFVMDAVRRLGGAKQVDKVIALLVKATAEKKSTVNMHAMLAASYLQKGKLDLARLAADSAVRKDPDNIVGYRTLMQVYKKEMDGGAKRLPQIRKMLDQAFDRDSKDVKFNVSLALMAGGYLDLDKTAKEELEPRIRKLLDEAWGTQPKDPLLMEQVSRGYRMINARKEAALVTEALMKALPNNPTVLLQLAQDKILAGDLKGGRMHLEALLKKNPGVWRAHQLLAAVAMDEDEFATAAKHYREAIKLEPRIEQLYYDLISALLSDDKGGEAGKVLDLVKRKFRPSFLQSYFAAMIHLEAKAYPDALADLKKAEDIAKNTDPTRLNHILYFQLGTTAERSGKIEEAVTYFRKSIKLKPDYATALNYLGYMWADRGENLDEAIELIDRALKEDPDNGAFLDSRAWALFKQGKVKEALEWQLKALKNTKDDDAEIFLHLGEMYLALKQPGKAREFLTKAAGVKDAADDVKKRIQDVMKQLP